MDRIKILKLTLATLAVSGMGMLTIASPGLAQGRLNKNALEKTKFYEAPREVQIIDDRPVVRDFREAPQDAGSIELPPGPQGAGGQAGGGGAGALGGGAPSSIPAGGMQMGGPNQGYRTPAGERVPLAKSGFNGPSNIPARGMGPRGALPDASSTNRLMGKMLNPGVAKGVMAGPSRGMAPTPARTNGNYNAPKAQTYSGGYGEGQGSGYGGSASQTQSNVRGSLLRH